MLADLLVPVALAKKYPGYSHLMDTISALGARKSPVRIWENVNLVLVGSLFMVSAIGQAQFFKPHQWSSTLYILGILTFASGCILAGIFPADPQKSLSTKIHGVASGIGFIALSFNPLWAVFMQPLKGVRVLNGFLFVCAVLTFSLFVASENRETGCLKYTGLYQRLNLIILYLCLSLNGIQ